MKRLSLYRIKELGLGSGRAVFSVQQFSNLIRKPRAIAIVYMARLVNNKMAKRLLSIPKSSSPRDAFSGISSNGPTASEVKSKSSENLLNPWKNHK